MICIVWTFPGKTRQTSNFLLANRGEADKFIALAESMGAKVEVIEP